MKKVTIQELVCKNIPGGDTDCPFTGFRIPDGVEPEGVDYPDDYPTPPNDFFPIQVLSIYLAILYYQREKIS